MYFWPPAVAFLLKQHQSETNFGGSNFCLGCSNSETTGLEVILSLTCHPAGWDHRNSTSSVLIINNIKQQILYTVELLRQYWYSSRTHKVIPSCTLLPASMPPHPSPQPPNAECTVRCRLPWFRNCTLWQENRCPMHEVSAPPQQIYTIS